MALTKVTVVGTLKEDLRVRRTASNNGAVFFGDTNGNYVYGSDVDDIISFATNGSERSRVTSNGITFNGDSASANALDDYEEWTWTPDVHTRTSAAPAIQVGKYIKIGSQVSAQCHLNFSATLTATDNSSQLIITGLPYASANVTNYFTVISGVHFNNSFTYSAPIGNLNGLLGVNGTTIGFHYKNGATMTLLPVSAIGTGNLLFGITYSTT